MNAITFNKAWLKSIRHVIANASVTSQVECVAYFTAAVAKSLDARWLLFDKENAPKDGYSKVDLDFAIKNVDFRLDVEKVPSVLQLMQCEKVHKFTVRKTGATKKGKPSKLVVQFRADYTGAPLDLMEWLIKYGSAEGALVLTPREQQGELPINGAKANRKAAGTPTATAKVQ